MVSLRITTIFVLLAVAVGSPLIIDAVVRDEDTKDCPGVPERVKMGDDCDDAKLKWKEHIEKTTTCDGVPYRVDKGTPCIEELSKYRRKLEEERSKVAEEKAKEIEEDMKPYMDGGMSSSMPRVSRCGAAKKMSDSKLFEAAIQGRKVGRCHIAIHPEEFKLCYMYVKTGNKRKGASGFPLMRYTDNSLGGDGCVHDKGGPKGVDQPCWYKLQSFGLTEEEQNEVCTPFGMVNAVNQIRMALNKGMCC